ncbi:MAG: DUF1826 domain-containing protein [Alphaproteobacteria bacterium]|nr:DUF1826 domain-containing protein [Alphaproteobacteria bacterium]
MSTTNPTIAFMHSLVKGGVARGERPEILSAVQGAAVDLALWERSIPPCLTYWLQSLNLRDLPDMRFSMQSDRRNETISRELYGMSSAFIADVQNLSQQYVQVSGCEQLSVRLECVTDNACRKFHTDYVGLRLITSYTGPGTEWTTRDALNSHSHQLHVGCVGLFKGRKWKGGYEPFIVHRSPPIAGTGIARLVLVIDDLLLDPEDVCPPIT